MPVLNAVTSRIRKGHPLIVITNLAGRAVLSVSRLLPTFFLSFADLLGMPSGLQVALLAALGALPGSWLGTTVQLHIPENVVRIMMVCVIPVVAVVVLGRKGGLERQVTLPRRTELLLSLLIGLVVGFYDGLVGPGTGTFLILLFTLLLGMDTVRASGTAKLVNLASNVAAFITYAVAGDVLYALAIPAAACAIVGNVLGANMTMKRGTGFIRRMLLVVLALLLAKMVWDVVS